MEICDVNNCTGCQACRLVCSVYAISMQANNKGFDYPIVDDSLCIKCNNCIEICPSNISSIQHEEVNFSQKVYAAWVKDKETRLFSTSGGLFFALAKFILQKKGVVFGVEWYNYGARHIYCTKIEELKKFQGSKYVQSDVGDSYLQVKNFLAEKRLVLYSGTPCQIAGLKSYLGKFYDNLFTVDIVCHGVPSPKILKEYITQVENENNDNIVNVRFRHKTPSWFLTSVKIDMEKNEPIIQSVFQNGYFRGFVENFYLRESCYCCKYANTERQGDITLADFWHYYPQKLKFASYDKGTSLVIVNSRKGQALFNNISSKIVFEEKDFNIAKRGNRNLVRPQNKPEKYDSFWGEYFQGVDFNVLFYKYFPPLSIPKRTFKIKSKFWIKLLLPEFVIRIAKKTFKKLPNIAEHKTGLCKE